MESDLKIGSIVKLKSGGPTMTINGSKDAKIYSCVWFEDTHQTFAPFFADFAADALEDCTPVEIEDKDEE